MSSSKARQQYRNAVLLGTKLYIYYNSNYTKISNLKKNQYRVNKKEYLWVEYG